MKRIMTFTIIAILIFMTGCNKTPEPVNNNESKQTQSDYFKKKADGFKLSTFKGNKIKLSDLQGKIVVINFFTTWCKYCKLEMPDFIEVMKDSNFKDKVKFLFIDVEESKKDVESFLKKYKYEGLDPLMDTDGKIFTAYGASGFPSTYIIDKAGNISFHQDGEMEKGFLVEKIKATEE